MKKALFLSQILTLFLLLPCMPRASTLDNCEVGCPTGGSSQTLVREAYTLNNNRRSKSPKSASFYNYQVTVEEIERRTYPSLSFWSALPVEIARDLKTRKGTLARASGCVEK